MNDAEKLAVIGEDGWRSIDNPPDSDRTIQLAWEDGSYGDSSLGFYDEKAIIPSDGVKYWWVFNPMRPISLKLISGGYIFAWREKPITI